MNAEVDTGRRLILRGLAAVALVAADTHAGAGTGKSTNGRVVTLHAKPGPFVFDTSNSAVIVIDMQNDFGSKGGMFDRAGVDISGIQKAIAPTGAVLASARRAGIKIIYLKMAYRPDLSDLGAPDSPNRMRHLQMGVGNSVRAPDGRESRILIRDTWNTDIVAELVPKHDDIVMYKHRFSGFYQTALDSTLKEHGIKHLVVTGCTTSVCVEATVRDAHFRDYSCVLLTDCMNQPTLPNSVPGTSHDASLVVTEAFLGWTSSSARFVTAMTA